MLAHAPRLAAPDDPETAMILVRTVTPQGVGKRIPCAVVYQAIRIMGSLGRMKPELQPLFTEALYAVLNDTDDWPRWAGDEVRKSALEALAQFGAAAYGGATH